MSRRVNCVKLNKEMEGLLTPPYPGELGQRIYQNISKQIWEEWLRQQVVIINENRLSSVDTKTQELLKKEMLKYLFDEG